MKKLIIEFLGTFFFILTIALTGNPFSIAAILMAWTYIGGYISGGHYNPMISVASAIRGSLPWCLVPHYILSQILGGFAAFAMTYYLTHNVVAYHPAPEFAFLQAFIVETLLAFVFALVVLVVATSDRFKGSHIFGLAIGFTVPALTGIGKRITGGLFNPAISIGSILFAALKGAHIIYSTLFMYVGGAFLGGILAAYFFKNIIWGKYNSIVIIETINQ